MSEYNPDIHHRRSIRLRNWNYRNPALYFITTCTQNRKCFFGDTIARPVLDASMAPPIKSPQMILNNAGIMIKNNWINIFKRFKNTKMHEYVVMPNHFHGIIEIVAPLGSAHIENGLGDIIGAFKSLTTNEYIRGVKQLNWQPFDKKLWQRNYYEHIIRNENDFERIIQYIKNNPFKWIYDSQHQDI